jgi:hypothetical protein
MRGFTQCLFSSDDKETMQWSSTSPHCELTLGALIREIFAEHPDDPALLPLHMDSDGVRRGRSVATVTMPGILRHRAPSDRLS